MTTTPPITDQAGRAQALVAFLLEDCPREAFTTELYALASSVVGYEAHLGPDGFYTRWFATPAARAAGVVRRAGGQFAVRRPVRSPRPQRPEAVHPLPPRTRHPQLLPQFLHKLLHTLTDSL